MAWPAEPVAALGALIVEARVPDERRHVDVTDAVQEKAQVLRCQPFQGRACRAHTSNLLPTNLNFVDSKPNYHVKNLVYRKSNQ